MDKTIVYEKLIFETFLATGYSSPNPPVGCVAVDFASNLLASAHTQITGKNHAERELYQNPPFLANLPLHDLYVTLEPCSHYGKTPPCRDLIIKYKPRYLILGHRDPNPVTQEKHSESMRMYLENGIHTIFSNEVGEISYPFLNGFFSRICKRKPKITIKTAVTNEGYFCPKDKTKVQINQASTSLFLQMLRAKIDAIMVGMGTILQDKPSLDFRIPSFQAIEEGIVKPISERIALLKNESIFWNCLWNFSIDPVIWNLHSLKKEYYQPKRIFMIEGESHSSEWKEFYEKQERLKESYPKTDIIFFLKQDPNCYSKIFKKNLEKIGKTFYPPYTKHADTILEILAEEGVNHLLIEGGNSLYKMFYDSLDVEDTILVVKNPSLFWDQGLLPYFWENLNHHELIWKYTTDSKQGDEIFVYRGRRKG